MNARAPRTRTIENRTDLLDGSPMDFDAFFERHHARLFAALCLTTGSRHEAEEIAQDAFLRILERWERVSELDGPESYLFTTAMNIVRKRYRRAKIAARIPIPRPDPAPDDAFSTIDDRDVRDPSWSSAPGSA
jgi:DNA-directed RNA polymerase specialized sigma24 family protein